MEFFLEMLLTLAFALLLSFPLAMLLSMATSGNRPNDPSSETVVDDHSVTEGEVSFALKMDASVSHSERNILLVDDNVEPVDRFGTGDDRLVELQEAATGNGKSGGELVVLTPEAESTAAVSPDNVRIVRGQDEQSESAREIGAEHRELMLQTTEAEHPASVSQVNVIAEERITQRQEERRDTTEGPSDCVEHEESGDVLVTESDELRDEETNTAEERSDTTEGTRACLEYEESGDVVVTESDEVRVQETNTVEESEHTLEENEYKEELSIEEDDDWEGIEKSELEKAFGAATKLLEESGKSEEIGAEAKMELYALHKIATEGSCREAQPMAVMLSARAKWNAWQKLGNMTQEEAMEQYLALVSKEIPDFMNTGHTVVKMPEVETSVVLHPNSGSVEDLTTVKTTGDESSKNGKAESSV